MLRRVLLSTAAVLVAGGIATSVVIVVSDDANALTKTEYVAHVNAVCRVYNARLAKIQAPLALGNPQAIAQSIGEALPLVVERAEKVRAIAPPAELAGRVRAMLAASDRAILELRRAYAHARANRLLESTGALGRFLNISDQAKQMARKIGFSC